MVHIVSVLLRTWMVLTISLVWVHLASVKKIQCYQHPCKCTYFPNSIKIKVYDCTNANLTEIPDFLKNSSAQEIYLNDNSISNLAPSNTSGVFPKSLKILDVSNNSIKFLTENVFSGLFNLITLNLFNNYFFEQSLEQPSSLFKDLISLKTINLQMNADRTQMNNPDYQCKHSKAFENLKNLETLKTDAVHFPSFDIAFRNLSNLRTLEISGENGICLLRFLNASSFCNVPHLRILRVNSCQLQRIEVGTFMNMKPLQELDISNNYELTLNVIPNVTRDLGCTNTTILKANKLHCTFGSGISLSVKHFRFINGTKLREVHLDSNRLNFVDWKVTKMIPKEIKKASLKDNRWTFGMYALHLYDIQGIEYVDLSDQHVSHDPSDARSRTFICNDEDNWKAGVWEGDVGKVIDKNCKTLHCQSGTYGELENNNSQTEVLRRNDRKPKVLLDNNLKTGMLEEENIRKSGVWESNIEETEVLEGNTWNSKRWEDNNGRAEDWKGDGEKFRIWKTNNEKLGKLENEMTVDVLNSTDILSRKNTFPWRIIRIYVPKTLKTVKMKRGFLYFPVPDFAVNVDNNIENLDFSENVLFSLNGPVYGLNKLKTLNISNVRCANIKKNFFHTFPSLENLDMSVNLFDDAFYLDQEGNIFSSLKKLKYLNLSHNRISFLPKTVFRGLIGLEELHLEKNSLVHWKTKLSHMKNLSIINLSSNYFTHLPKTFTDEIDELLGARTKNGSLQIDLSSNYYLRCECNTIHFLKWCHENMNAIVDVTSLKCVYCGDERDRRSFRDLGNIIIHLEQQCGSYVGVIFGTSALIFLVLSFLIFSLLYRYRWKIRYLYYMTSNRYRRYQTKSRDNRKTYKYDAFVSYADENKTFVLDEMVKELEMVSNLKLCLSSRDFTPGVPIAANITRAINKSKKTIVVLTSEYLASYWCMYEFNMARMESIYARSHESILFLIFYEKVPFSRLPNPVLEMVHSKSFIEYPTMQQGRTVFWEKIRDTIAEERRHEV